MRVTFACRPGAVRPTLTSIVEPAVCAYEAVIAYEAFCSDDAYSKLAWDTPAIMNVAPASPAVGYEFWNVEIQMLSGSRSGVALCQAYSVGEVSSAAASLRCQPLSTCSIALSKRCDC
jgi:hypothetical protein